MTIKIEIEVPTDLVLKGIGSDYLDMAAGALGFTRGVSSVSQPVLKHTEVAFSDGEFTSTVQDEKPEPSEEAAQDFVHRDEARAEAPKRERGKPSQGRSRRTKEEIAEDEAADAADAAKANAPVVEIASMKMLPDDATPQEVAEAFANISTGGERISPEDEQDAADEAAETEKTGLASIDVLRRLVGDYQKKHGMPAAVKLCQEGGLIGKPIHELDDAGIEAAIAAMQGGGVAETKKVEEKAPAEEPAPKTKADLAETMMRYADKYDGTRDQAKMVHTLADMPKVFVAEFGDSVQKLSQVPADKYAEAVAAVEAAIKADPYGRAK